MSSEAFNPNSVMVAIYAGKPVYECKISNVLVIRRMSDDFVNANHLLNLAEVSRSDRVKIMETRILTLDYKKVQGGIGRLQGTYIGLQDAIDLSKYLGIYRKVEALLTIDGNVEYLMPKPVALSYNRTVNTNITPCSSIKNAESYSVYNKVQAATIDVENIIQNKGKRLTRSSSAASRPSADSFIETGSVPIVVDSPASDSLLERSQTGQINTEEKRLRSSSPSSVQENKVDHGDPTLSLQPLVPPPKKYRFCNYEVVPLVEEPSSFFSSPSKSSNIIYPTPSQTPVYHASDEAVTINKTAPPIDLMDGITLTHPQPVSAKSALVSHVVEAQPTSTLSIEKQKELLMAIYICEDVDNVLTILKYSAALLTHNLHFPLDEQGNTALHWLSALSRLHILDAIKNVFPINLHVVNHLGETAIMKSVYHINNYQRSTFLDLLDISQESVINHKDKKGWTLLHHIISVFDGAGSLERKEMAKYYLKSFSLWFSFHMNVIMLRQPVKELSKTEADELLEELGYYYQGLLKGKDRNSKEKRDAPTAEMLLERAIKDTRPIKNKLDLRRKIISPVVASEIEDDEDVEEVKEKPEPVKGPTHLYYSENYIADRYSDADLFQFLDAKDAQGNTALHMACETGDRSIVSILLDLQARTDIPNHHGVTARDLMKKTPSLLAYLRVIDSQYYRDVVENEEVEEEIISA